jgi:UDP-3-O-[3-hydroxymyristoyl] glucosamine N-acyltransferase
VEAGCTIRGSRLRDTLVGANTRIDGSSLHDSLIGANVHVANVTGSVSLADHSEVRGE